MTVAQAASRLAASLSLAGKTLACAESCTGGLAAAALTQEPGASEFFLGGVVAYSNEAKTVLLGVPTDVIREQGAVSEKTALALAAGAARALGSDYAFAITGIAGPSGGSPDKPVGTVWFGFFTAGAVVAERRVFEGERSRVRNDAAAYALARMAELSEANADGPGANHA